MAESDTARERADKIIAMLRERRSFGEIAAEMMPPEERSIMRVISLLRNFDTDTFRFAISKSEVGATDELRRLKADGSVQESFQSPGLYSVPQRIREPQLKSWDILMDTSLDRLTGSEAEAFVQLHSKLASHFKGKPQWGFEYLHHLVVASPSDGIDLMEQLLKECLPQPDEQSGGASDAVHSEACDGIALARACDILDIVDGQKRFLPRIAKDRYKELRRLAGAWSSWCDAWLRTRRYISRDEVHGWFTDLHHRDTNRILEIHAPGGSGKTMSLRWLIAHHCIPRKKPIAHLDFDRFIGNPQRPWQLLLQCAEQINRQLPGAPFDGLIREGRDMQEALVSNASVAMDSLGNSSFETSYPVRFGNVVKSSTNEIVTIIVDTFEEAMVRNLTPVPPFVAMLVRLASSCPQIRLILCGRYSMVHRDFASILKTDFPNEFKFYQSQLKRRAILQFDKSETEKYLRKRGVNLDEDHLNRLVDASSEIVDTQREGHDRRVSPFHLSLIADLIRDRKDDPGRTDQLIKDIRLVKVIYLIERVLSRINDVGVRWLLRYGVVPRQLSRDFFKDVILPYLMRVNRGKLEGDNTDKKALPPDLAEESLYFKESKILEEDQDVIWNSLCGYASSDSWVEQQGSDVLSFHTCVREPMRGLLRERDVLRSIHRDAAKHFELKATAAVDSRGRIAAWREAIYHHIQLQGREGAEYCERLCRGFMDAEDFQTAFELAEEIVSSEYRPQGDQALVGDETVRSVCQMQCLAAIDLADLAGNDLSSRKEVESENCAVWLRRADDALVELKGQGPSETIPSIIKSMIAVRMPHQSHDQMRESVGQLESVLNFNPPANLHDRIVRSMGIGQAKLDDRRCVEHFAKLLNARLGSAEQTHRPMTGLLISSLARGIAIHGNAGPELRALSEAIRSISTTSPDNRLFCDVTRVATALMETWMRPEAAASLIEERLDIDDELELRRIRATVKDDPIMTIERLLSFGGQRRDQSANLKVAESLIDAAWAYAMLANINSFRAAMGDAFGSFRSARETYLATRCRIMDAEICAHHYGNYALAGRAIREWGRSAHAKSTDDDPEALRVRLLTYEINRHTSEPLSTPIDPIYLLDEAERSSRWAIQIRCAMTLFANLESSELEKQADRIAELLIRAFTCLPDGVARSCHSWLLRDSRREVRLERKLHDRLRDLILSVGEDTFGKSPGASDWAWADVSNAHLLRFLGETHIARGLTQSADRYFSQRRSLAGLREVWHLNAIFGSKQPSPRELDSFDDDEFRSLRRTIAVEQAEHCLVRKDVPTASKWLELIELQELDSLPSCFGPRAFVAMAERDAQHGDMDSAARFLQRAEDACGQLDDKLALSQFRSRFAAQAASIETLQVASTDVASLQVASARPDNEPVWSAAPFRSLKLTYASEKQRDAEVVFGVGHLAEFNGDLSRSAQSLLREKLMADSEAAPYELVEAIANHPGTLAGPVIERLFRDELPHPDGSAASDLVIASEHISLAAVPWEVARLNQDLWRRYHFGLLYRAVSNGERYRMRWLQEALRATGEPSLIVDGHGGPGTAKALSVFIRNSGLTEIAEVKREFRRQLAGHPKVQEPWAVILQSTFERQKVSQRGLEISGEMLPKLYEGCGFRCRTFHGQDLDTFYSEWHQATPPAIIHIYAPYVESRSSGSVEPDFGNTYSTPKKSRSRTAAPAGPSLLILDGPAESDPIEQMRQIFLRNATGTLLAQSGMANIIGLGLDTQLDFNIFEKLLSGIRNGLSLRELYSAIIDRAPAMSHDQLDTDQICGAAGTVVPAIWTADPDLSVLLSTETRP